MSGGGGKGGSKTTEQVVKLPDYIEQAGKENLALARDISRIGPILEPETLPTLAALTPMEMAAMQNTGQAAGAFGVAGGNMTGMEGMPAPQQFAGGITGYSAAPLTQAALQGWQQAAPAQYDFVQSFFNDPVSGSASSRGYSGSYGGGGSSAPVQNYYQPASTAREIQYGLTPEMKARGMTIADVWR